MVRGLQGSGFRSSGIRHGPARYCEATKGVRVKGIGEWRK